MGLQWTTENTRPCPVPQDPVSDAQTQVHLLYTRRDCKKSNLRYSPIVLSIVLVASRVLQLAPTLAVATGSHHDHIPGIMQMEQRVPGLRAHTMHVPVVIGGKNPIIIIIYQSYINMWRHPSLLRSQSVVSSTHVSQAVVLSNPTLMKTQSVWRWMPNQQQ